MFNDVFKRLAFLIVYLPGLIYGCQYSYYLGLTEPINANLAEVGLSNNEVLFFGLISTSLMLFEIIDKIFNYLSYIPYFIGYVILCFLSLYLGIHESKRSRFRPYLHEKFFELKYYFTYRNQSTKTNQPIIFIIKLITVYFFWILFLIAFLMFSASYRNGVNEVKKIVQEIHGEKNTLLIGSVSENNIKYKAYKLVCGSYKCIGLDLDKNRNVTFLPENYKQDFSFKKFSEDYKLAETK